MAVLIEVKQLKKYFPVKEGIIFGKVGGWIKAVDGVDLFLEQGETIGIVGESGSGKTTIAKMILLLEKASSGNIMYKGKDLYDLHRKEILPYRRSVQPVFQDPGSSLSPRMKVGEIVAEPLEIGGQFSKKEIRSRVADALELVGLPVDSSRLFPNQFSGGQMQRIAIARAICSTPDVIILDEPISALDLSIRAQIMNLLMDLQKSLGHSYVLISHDLAAAIYMCTNIAVMYLGKVVEIAPSEQLWAHQRHPYSEALFAAALPQHPRDEGGKPLVVGEIPSPLNPPSGCHFHPRCRYAQPVCSEQEPILKPLVPLHSVACHFPLNDGESANATPRKAKFQVSSFK